MKKENLVEMKDLEIVSLEDEDLASVTGGCTGSGACSMFACSAGTALDDASTASDNVFGTSCPETKSSGIASGNG